MCYNNSINIFFSIRGVMKNRATLNKLSVVLIVVFIFIFSSFCLMSCNKKAGKKYIDYTKNNEFEIEHTTYVSNPDAEESEQYGMEIYCPKDNNPKYGLIFYVGTVIPAEKYNYLSTALAKAGFLVIIPNVSFNMTYGYYEEQTVVISNKVLKDYSDVQFFIGGHSQGGGAAMRFSTDNQSKILGAIFLSPLCYSDLDTDDSKYGLSNSNLPALLLEAQGDCVLNASQKSDAEERMPQGVERHVIDPGAHMSFSEWEDDATLSFFYGDGLGITEEGKALQKTKTIEYIFGFIYKVIGIEK